MTQPAAASLLPSIWAALGGGAELPGQVRFVADGALPSVFAVTDLAAASIGAAGLAAAELIALNTGRVPAVTVDRRLASFWFATSLRPSGWRPPPPWDPIAGDYATRDGWIRLHTNAPHHRRAAEAVLGAGDTKQAVSAAVAGWDKDALEGAVVEAGGCAAAMHALADWAAHPQGRAVRAEPLAHWSVEGGTGADRPVSPARPLAGVRVLDLTRVLAGPIATRFLAGCGAAVLRIDPPGWDEAGVVPEVTLGKRCARLDLHRPEGRAAFEALLAQADILVHGYRADALERLGYGAAARRTLSPGLVDVSLDAYGWSGPWQHRRGFDSLVQMSAGIAEAGMRRRGAAVPVPLPVQALDHATGYMMAAAAIRGWCGRLRAGEAATARLSLARTAALLTDHPAGDEQPLAAETPDDLAPGTEETEWGPARRLRPPVAVDGAALRWDLPASSLGSSAAVWNAVGA